MTFKTLMLDMGVYEPIRFEDLSTDEKKRAIHSSAFVVAVKARWVGAGNQMDRSAYESGSSTETLFTQLALAAGEGMTITTIDIGSAYLHSDMNEFVAVYIAPHLARYACQVDKRLRNHIDSRGRVLVKLKKALYGCIQSSRLWFETMRDVLLEAGFAANDYDRCLFHKGHPGSQVNVCLHVDDLLVSSSVDNGADELVAFLRKRFKEVKVRDSPENGYLGMRIVQSKTSIEIDMIPYVDERRTRRQGPAFDPCRRRVVQYQ